MFDKDSLLQRLRALSFSEEDYWVVAGGAMVLHGVRPQTQDIDLGCSTSLADRLEQQGYAVTYCEDGTRKILYKRHLILASRIAQPVMPFIRFLGKI